MIGCNVLLTILSVEKGRIRVGITAPEDVAVLRRELSQTQDNFTESRGAFAEPRVIAKATRRLIRSGST